MLDVVARLLRDRIVMLGTVIDDEVANLRFAQATGQSPTRIQRACRESESFGAREAVRFGLIDEVASRR
ncbi:MAG: ATP-dependent Clp protease proteolytic subunit [Myxococcaceae bacterium]|nr:ATP-dependent Clp protease proteolytic subunit [Myxococcaceae bacterium]